MTNAVNTKNARASYLLSLGVALSLYGLLAKSVSFWSSDYLISKNGTALGFWTGVVLSLIAIIFVKGNFKHIELKVSGFASTLLIVFFSDWLLRGYNLLQGPLIRGEIILFFIVSLLLLVRFYKASLTVIAIAAPLLLTFWFFQTSRGELLFTDDHATFLYRLYLLKENFPFIPFFNPQWNGGIDARDFFATGTLNIFSIFAPLIYTFNLEKAYNVIIAILLFGLLPLSSFFAAKYENLPKPAPAIAAVLALSSSLLWYRWTLRYGTLGFATTAVLMPFNLALISKILDPGRELKVKDVILAFFSISLMLMWTPSGLALSPTILIGAFAIRRLLKKPYILKLVLALIIFNLPWVMLFWSASNVSTFLQHEKPLEMITQDRTTDDYKRTKEDKIETHKISKKLEQAGLNLPVSVKILREWAVSTNPLLLFLVLPGILLLRPYSRFVYGAVLGWLIVLGSILVPLKPQLELDRMLVLFAICAVAPVSMAIYKLLTQAKNSWACHALAAVTLSFLLSGFVSTGAIVKNRSIVPYFFMQARPKAAIAAIKDNVKEGRLLFSGFMLHHLGSAHLAPLPYFTGVPMIASSHVHNLWEYKQVFPHSFISREPEGIFEYLDLYNVSTVIAHEKRWRKFFSKYPDRFELKWQDGPFRLYKVKNFTDNYFIEGRGKLIDQSTNSITLKLATTDAVLKFNYFPFLKSSACNIKPKTVAEELVFIKLSDCPKDTVIEIKSKGAAARF